MLNSEEVLTSRRINVPLFFFSSSITGPSNCLLLQPRTKLLYHLPGWQEVLSGSGRLHDSTRVMHPNPFCIDLLPFSRKISILYQETIFMERDG